MEYAELMRTLGERLEIDEFTPDADGHYRLKVDGTVVSFVELPESGLMDTVAKVCDLPEEGGDRICRVLLSAMAPGGTAEAYAFFVMPDGKSVWLRRTDVLDRIDADGLREMLEGVADALAEWRKAIGDFGAALPVIDEELAKQAAENRRLDSNIDGFLRV